ncbi:MAG: hypothetical protein Kow0069_31160 [Promethearchaeota archaeon]
MGKYYRAYVLCRLARIGTEWEVVEAVLKLKPKEGEDWKVTYATPVYGMWDLLIELSYTHQSQVDTVVTFVRNNPEFRDKIEETTTLLGSRQNYPLDD